MIKPQFLYEHRDLIDELRRIANSDAVAADLLSDIDGYGSITPRQIKLGWWRIGQQPERPTAAQSGGLERRAGVSGSEGAGT